MGTEYLDSRIIHWEGVRRRALANSDSIPYSRACDELGIEPDNEDLYQAGVEWRTCFSEKSKLEKEATEGNVEQREFWVRVAKVALMRFPETEPGERIGIWEIKGRLRKIRKVGYDVRPYSKMNRREAWECLMQIKADIREKARQNCPDVLARIDDANEQARRR